MGEWSPESVRCVWLDGATEPAVGARFKGWNRRGVMRWSNTPVVIAADEGREFAFDRRSMGFSVIWRFTMEPSGTGTLVRECYRLERAAPPPPAGVDLFRLQAYFPHWLISTSGK
jgi:hypothetical protein